MTHAEALDVEAGAVAPLATVARLSNLPVPLTSFVGRERELAQLREALRETRQLTLTGPGGSGKTRLALEVASGEVDRFAGGVWWVELAPLAEEALVGAAVAESLGVRPLPGVTELQAACGYLASRRALVVLDNCEHLVGACAEAAEALLLAGPQIVVLATSRAPLGVGGESNWRVPSLSLPEPEANGSIGAVAASDAVSLFIERARKVHPGFAVTEENARAIARVCDELDGLPLALELAAARVRMLSVDQIAAGVSESLRLLTGGPRTASGRQQTLRASVDWSHDLLSADERLLLRRLAVFTGGFTLEAAEQICTGDGVERAQVLDVLGALVDQSLVIADERDTGARYRLLETVRQYGLERLAHAGEGDSLRDRHRDFYLALAEQAAPELETGRQPHWVAVLDPEAANLAAAIDRALGSEPELALRFCAALYRYWPARGRLAEAELAHSRALEACGDREPALRARVLRGRAMTASYAGRYEAAEAHTTEALALAEEVGDGQTAARARGGLGAALVWTNPPAARTALARAAELARAAGDDWALVHAKQVTAQTYIWEADHARAAAANDEVAELAERVGEPLNVARRWSWFGWMAVHDGRLFEARDAAKRARAAVSAVGEPNMEAIADVNTAFVDIWEGAPETALAHLKESLDRTLKLGAGLAVPWLLTTIAWAELATVRHTQARDRLEAVVPLIEGRDTLLTSWAVGLLAEARRLLGDGDAADAGALHAQATGEQLGNRLLATLPRLTLGRLAAAGGDWTVAQEHARAHLDACAEGGHATSVPSCLDVLGEVAAGVRADKDAVRLFAAAGRARTEIGSVRVPPEEGHCAAIDDGLRDTLGPQAYEAARAEGAELTIDDALEWARRTRGPRRRPATGWASLTPTEARVAELVAEGLTNPQIGARMFISKATVKTHLAHIFKKLDVHSRAELSALAARRNPAS